jgi:phosphohistidine swiveling domain-containing protein
MPFARTTDPETSHEAAESVTNITPLKQEILQRLMTPMTDADLIEAIRVSSRLIVTESGVRSRRAELVQAGLVKDTGARIKLATGRNAIVWTTNIV